MPSGIFNPYAAPPKPTAKKRDFQSTIDVKNPYNSEYVPGKKTTDISLDGDTYVVVFHSAQVETVTTRLGELMQELVKEHREELQRYGIDFGADVSAIPSALILPTPLGLLRVDTGGEQNEIVAYRRLGYALSRMNVKPILKKHAIRVYVRG
jgi:hypothetical protein